MCRLQRESADLLLVGVEGLLLTRLKVGCYLPRSQRPTSRACGFALEQVQDSTLIVRIAGGDRESLSLLYNRYAPIMLAVGMRILKDEKEAEDLIHDVFLEVWKKAGDYSAARGSVKTWLMLRLRSRALDRCKSTYRSRVVQVEPRDRRFDGVDASENPAMGVDRRTLQRALQTLPEEQRRVLELSYFRGLSSSEISAQLSVPLGTVKSRAAAGLGKLRKVFRGGKGGAA